MKKAMVVLVVIGMWLMATGNVQGCTGARPIGMGGAFIAVADDANATYWNPAGLAEVSESSAVTGEQEGRRYTSNETYVTRLSAKKGLGFFVTADDYGWTVGATMAGNLAVPVRFGGQTVGYMPFPERKQLSFNLRQKTTWYTVSVGQKVSKRSAVGINFRMIHPDGLTDPSKRDLQKMTNLVGKVATYKNRVTGEQFDFYVDQVNLSGMNTEPEMVIDLSYKFQFSENWTAGMLIQGIDYRLQSSFPRFGVAYEEGRLTLAADYYHQDEMGWWSKELIYGGEYRAGKLSFRAGLYKEVETRGLGIQLSDEVSVDLTKFGNTYMIGTSFKF